MDKLIRIHRDKEQLDYNKIWNEGIFVFDSNVLLDLYRLPKSARIDLISVLENPKISKRIWIGFQVLIEFLNNRYEAISDQKNKFNSVKQIINKAQQKYEDLYSDLDSELKHLKLNQRHSLINPDKFINSKNKQKGNKFLNDFLKNLESLEIKQSDVNDYDDVKELVLKIFKEKIGKGFERSELLKIYENGEERYKKEIPPGYKDIKKEGAYYYEDKEYIRKFGDLILWNELIEKVISDKIKYIVLITGDIKEDWWFKKRGQNLGPRNELLNEIYTKAPELDTFFMYDTSTFLKYAQTELDSKIKDSTINEVKELIKYNDLIKYIGIEETLGNILEEVKRSYHWITVEVDSYFKNISSIIVKEHPVHMILMEIFSNVSYHSSDRLLSISSEENEKIIKLKFQNSIDQFNASKALQSRSGLNNILGQSSKINFDCQFYIDNNIYTLELYIPK